MNRPFNEDRAYFLVSCKIVFQAEGFLANTFMFFSDSMVLDRMPLEHPWVREAFLTVCTLVLLLMKVYNILVAYFIGVVVEMPAAIHTPVCPFLPMNVSHMVFQGLLCFELFLVG